MLQKILKPLSILPALIIMCSIFSFSGQTGDDSGSLSYKISHAIISAGDNILNTNLSSERIVYYTEKIHTPVRKLAHMTEYLCLAVAVCFPLYIYHVKGYRLIIISGVFCVVFACTDEFHQLFVSGRAGSIKDVGIDSIGIFLGIALSHLFIFKTKNRPKQILINE